MKEKYFLLDMDKMFTIQNNKVLRLSLSVNVLFFLNRKLLNEALKKRKRSFVDDGSTGLLTAEQECHRRRCTARPTSQPSGAAD